MTHRWSWVAYALLGIAWIVGFVLLALLVAALTPSAPTTGDGPATGAERHATDTRPALAGGPSPTAETGIPGSVLTSMSATSLSGYATWYATPGLTGAAGPALRAALGGDPAFRGQRVTVCRDRCVTVTLTDWCACGSRAGEPTLVDLSDDAFLRLAPLSSGVIEVAIRIPGVITADPTVKPKPIVVKPQPTLPPTDSEGPIEVVE